MTTEPTSSTGKESKHLGKKLPKKKGCSAIDQTILRRNGGLWGCLLDAAPCKGSDSSLPLVHHRVRLGTLSFQSSTCHAPIQDSLSFCLIWLFWFSNVLEIRSTSALLLSGPSLRRRAGRLKRLSNLNTFLSEISSCFCYAYAWLEVGLQVCWMEAQE